MISVKLTFYGLCKEVIRFYSEIFDVKVLSLKTFKDAKEAFPGGIEEKYEDFIFEARLELTVEDSHFYMTVGDTPTILFTGTDHLSGCKDNIAFDIIFKNPARIKEIYQKFIDAGSKNNIVFSEMENGILRCSVIDPFGICFTMFC